jgi:hypothetical protein
VAPSDAGENADTTVADATDATDAADVADVADVADAGAPTDAADASDGGDAGDSSDGADAADGASGPDAACSVPSVGQISGFDCMSRPQSTCGQCLDALGGGDTACACLTGVTRTNCQALVRCLAPGFFTCFFRAPPDPIGLACYCSDATCSHGADGQCAAAFHLVAGSSDPAELRRQLADPSTTVYRVAQEAKKFGSTAACGMYCGCL